MINLFLLNEIYTNGYIPSILDIISFIAILCAVLIIGSKNPIFSILFLIGLFGCISLYLLILGFSFIGLSYLIVYIGAVSILFLFILMLINIRISELQSNTKNSIFLSILIIICFNYFLFQILPYNITVIDFFNYYFNYIFFFNKNHFYDFNNLDLNNKNIIFVTTKIWDGYLIENNHIASIGNIMYTNYSIWLILTSFILLLAMVGAIIITIKQKD